MMGFLLDVETNEIKVRQRSQRGCSKSVCIRVSTPTRMYASPWVTWGWRHIGEGQKTWAGPWTCDCKVTSLASWVAEVGESRASSQWRGSALVWEAEPGNWMFLSRIQCMIFCDSEHISRPFSASRPL